MGRLIAQIMTQTYHDLTKSSEHPKVEDRCVISRSHQYETRREYDGLTVSVDKLCAANVEDKSECLRLVMGELVRLRRLFSD